MGSTTIKFMLWLEIPRSGDFRGSAPKNWKIAREERYIDEEGEVREAI